MKHQQLKTSPEISKRMSHVKTKRNSAEIMIAKSLWHRGYRYRLNYKTLPESPDIAPHGSTSPSSQDHQSPTHPAGYRSADLCSLNRAVRLQYYKKT